eukprot:scaffold65912_cov41-Attheya_sp.AAC.1
MASSATASAMEVRLLYYCRSGSSGRLVLVVVFGDGGVSLSNNNAEKSQEVQVPMRVQTNRDEKQKVLL